MARLLLAVHGAYSSQAGTSLLFYHERLFANLNQLRAYVEYDTQRQAQTALLEAGHVDKLLEGERPRKRPKR